MTPAAHKERHITLHKALDELFADFINNSGGRSSDTIMNLIEWSHRQETEPDHSAQATRYLDTPL